MKRLVREPLLQFLLLGLALFALHAVLAPPSESRAGADIVVSSGRIRSLAESFARQWNRPPSDEELAGLVGDFVREEVLVREALALGLDRDDTIVRRRLAQKMQFLTEDVAAFAQPTDEELDTFLTAHAASFCLDARVTFSQVFLDRQKRGDAIEDDAASLIAALEAPDPVLDPESLGDGRMLPARLDDATASEVAAQFGADFAERLAELAHGRWHWPVESAYGPHLVRVERRMAGRVPELDEVRDAVAREWSAAKRRELEDAHFRSLLSRYSVTIEEPTGSATPALTEATR